MIYFSIFLNYLIKVAKMQSTIRFLFCERLLTFELNSQSDYTLPSVLLKHCADWLRWLI